MQIYYSSLQAIEQQTMQLAQVPCLHCQQTHHLVSHGFIYKKRSRAEPEAVGKRVFCSNRNRHTGCGRTVQLYLASLIRYLHYAGARVVSFVALLMQGMSIDYAYRQATDAASARHAYRWLHQLDAQSICFRSLSHQAPLHNCEPVITPTPSPRRRLLMSTFEPLFQRWGECLCSAYQQQCQRPFLSSLSC